MHNWKMLQEKGKMEKTAAASISVASNVALRRMCHLSRTFNIVFFHLKGGLLNCAFTID